MNEEPPAPVVIGVDTGGTFTDVFTSDGRITKLPSTPSAPADAILAGLRAIGAAPGDSVGHGTTVATNAVLERRGARTALLTTSGFEDVLAIRRQNRPSLYDLYARWPEPLVERAWRLGVDERLTFEGEVLVPVNREQLSTLEYTLRDGDVQAVAVSLLHSYVDGSHEDAVGAWLGEILDDTVALSLSHRVAPRYGEYERTSTTVLNAYVMPVMQRYLQVLGIELRALGIQRLHVMHSNGGLLDLAAAHARPVQTLLSGPAAGVVGAQVVGQTAGHDQLITFDMGGTSTDVAVIPGTLPASSDGEIAGFPLLVPMLPIETVGAGGGSIARIDSAGGLRVGPQSAGADPGPAAYGRGTQPTVTDANLVLGRLSAHGLLGGTMPLEPSRARDALAPLAQQLGLTVEDTAWAVVRLANSNMERAVRTVTLQRGHDPRRFTLFAFGGAGPLHATELAAELGVPAVLIPPYPGVMAALGLTVPPLQRDFVRTVMLPLEEHSSSAVEAAFAGLEATAHTDLVSDDVFGEPIMERALDLRYAGQAFDLRVSYASSVTEAQQGFTEAYRDRYRAIEDRPIQVVNVRLQVTLPRLHPPQLQPSWPEASRRVGARPVWFSTGDTGYQVAPADTPVLWRPSLSCGSEVHGPAVLEQYDTATVIPPGWAGTVDEHFNLILRRAAS